MLALRARLLVAVFLLLAADVAAAETPGLAFAASAEQMISERLWPGEEQSAGDARFSCAVVFVAYNRVDALKMTLDSFEKVQGRTAPFFHALVSVDSGGDVAAVRDLTSQYAWVEEVILYNRSEGDGRGQKRDSRYHITRHYCSIFDRVFAEGSSFTHIIVFEDDFLFAQDALLYFAKMAPVLDLDHSLMCISAWNDNGFARYAVNGSAVLRTDVFPGLGWMMKRSLWSDELKHKWPASASTGWDHWLRLPEQTKGRSCLIPQVPRVFHFASSGVNVRQSEYERSFADISLHCGSSELVVDDRIALKDSYESFLSSLVAAALRVRRPAEIGKRAAARSQMYNGKPVYLLTYKREQFLHALARPLKIFRSPRAAYKGVIVLEDNDAYILLADVRTCPYLRSNERVHPNSNVTTVGAEMGESCSTACSGRGLKCSSADLHFLNACDVLREHFPCENGCGFETGGDLPAYVVPQAESMQTRGQCLVTDGSNLVCNGKFKYTRRLCPCI